VRTVKSAVGARMRVVHEEQKDEWSWAKELTSHFGNLSPGMRGSFKNPPPGTKVSEVLEDKNLALGQKVDDLEDEASRKNFRVAVIIPEEVEQVDLSDPDKARRWKFTFVGEGKGENGQVGEWKMEELWP